MSQDAEPPSSLGQRLLRKTTSGMPAQPDKGLSQQFLRKERPAAGQTQQGLDTSALDSYKESLAKRVEAGASQQGLPAQPGQLATAPAGGGEISTSPPPISLSKEIAAPYTDTMPMQAAAPEKPVVAAGPDSKRPVRPDRPADASTRAGSQLWFDAAGLIETVVTATNQVFRFQYDENQQITTVLEPDGSLVLNAGNGSWVRHLASGGSNSFFGTIVVKPNSDIEYNMAVAGSGDLLIVWSAGGSIANMRKAIIKHPLTGNAIESLLLTSVTDKNNNPVSVDYDQDGWPTRIIWGPRLLLRNDDRTWSGKDGDAEAYRFGGPEAVARELNGNVVINSKTNTIVLSRWGINS